MTAPPRERLTVVVAAWNEAEALPLLHARLLPVLDGLGDVESRVLYVDDGSEDASWAVMRQLAREEPRVALLRLSRNFGKEAALTAGLDRVEAGAAMILDADAQDPPELIPQFVAKWREGYDNVYGRRGGRAGEGLAKRASASLFYRVIGRLSRTPMPEDTGDFRLLSPRALQALRELRERHRFMKGLFGWVGFNSAEIVYDREPRAAGRSKFDFWKLWNLALDGITSFSTAPLRISTYLGLFTALFALGYGVYVIVKALMYGDPVAGWPSMMAVILFLGGVQLIALGMIGEYLGRLYVEAKQRPLYVVADWQADAGPRYAGAESEAGDGHAPGTASA